MYVCMQRLYACEYENVCRVACTCVHVCALVCRYVLALACRIFSLARSTLIIPFILSLFFLFHHFLFSIIKSRCAREHTGSCSRAHNTYGTINIYLYTRVSVGGRDDQERTYAMSLSLSAASCLRFVSFLVLCLSLSRFDATLVNSDLINFQSSKKCDE